ncbi:hypothetical protein BGC07_00675 [Piscirickettsia litoralis]|uniref:DDE domain-containing protein n=1 Tax=Piscirickettsia litoralis TaxID=1891921 RepID=A0ABX3A276_9GAMM|nr:hypothetical protein BGC07_00675 [Piscirickettsia litoralis]
MIVTDKLRSYNQPIKKCCSNADHRKHKGLNNRIENAHQPTRRREKSLIKMKSTNSAQKMLKLMGVTRHFFAVGVGRYRNPVPIRKEKLNQAFKVGVMLLHRFFVPKVRQYNISFGVLKIT